MTTSLNTFAKSQGFFILKFLCFICLAAATAATQDEYVFLLPAKGNPYWNVVAQGIEETAGNRKIKATIYQGQGDVSAEEQLNTCLTAIQRRPKFLALAAVNLSVGLECLKRASSEGIKIAEIDSTIPNSEAEKQGVHLLFSVGSGNFQVGRKAAQFASETLQDKDAEILVIEGAVGNPPSIARANGFKENIASLLPKAKIVFSVSANWDRLKAMNITLDALQRFPNLRLVYAVNDLMALGSVEAIKAQGKNGQIQVIGVDGISDSRRAVERGEMLATVAQLPYLIGKRSVELGIDVVQGKTVSPREVTDTPVLTKSVLASKNSLELQYVR